MNTPNNKRKKESQNKIEKVFIELIQNKELNEISVTEICKKAKINRSTFYANFLDVYDLADKIKYMMFEEVLTLYPKETATKIHSYNFLPLIENIKENPIFYRTLFKLNFDYSEYYDIFSSDEEFKKYYHNTKYMDYHKDFFNAGFNAVLKKWLNNDCKESPEEIFNIIKDEYKKKNIVL